MKVTPRTRAELRDLAVHSVTITAARPLTGEQLRELRRICTSVEPISAMMISTWTLTEIRTTNEELQNAIRKALEPVPVTFL